MRLLTPIWTSPRVKPPFGAVKVNRAHPLARGLAFFCLFRRDEPTGGIDLVRGMAGTTTSSPSRSTRGLTLSAVGMRTEWASALVGGDTPYIASSGLTLAWRGTITTLDTFGDFLLGKHAADGGTDDPFSFTATGPAIYGDQRLEVTRATATNKWSFSSGTGGKWVTGEVAEFTMTFADNLAQTVPLGYKNGASFTVFTETSGVNGAVTGTAQPLIVGYRPDGFFRMIGEVIHVAVWSRPLSAAEVTSFYNEPYALLTPVAQPLPTLDLPQGEGARILRSRMRTW